MRNTTLKSLVMSAYQLNEYQIAGGPKWMDSAKFNIDAKLPAGALQEQIPLMTQTMLADRFKLEFHRETRTLREYALVVAKGGPKFGTPSESSHKGVATSQSDNQITGWGRPISDLARMLIGAVGAPVVDQTGLKGQYDFDLKFAPLLGVSRDGDDARRFCRPPGTARAETGSDHGAGGGSGDRTGGEANGELSHLSAISGHEVG
jgi:uncharacterized protein (TIGR03435 family)